MMAGLFLLMTASIASLFFGRRMWVFWLLAAAFVFGFALLWHHATDYLKIIW